MYASLSEAEVLACIAASMEQSYCVIDMYAALSNPLHS